MKKNDKYNTTVWEFGLFKISPIEPFDSSKYTKGQLEISDVDLDKQFEESIKDYNSFYANIQLQANHKFEVGQIYRCIENVLDYRIGDLFFIHVTDIEDGTLMLSDNGIKGFNIENEMAETVFTPAELTSFFKRINSELEEQYWLEMELKYGEHFYGR